MNEHLLIGMDAQNPLAFLAALGLLRVLEEVREDEEARPRLAFRDEGKPVPVLHSERSLAEIYKAVLKDAKSKAGQVTLGLAYDAEGKLTEPDAKGAVADLRPSPQGARQFLEGLHGKRVDRRSVDLAAAFFSELVQDNGGKTKPTALYFTSGQQKFLTMVNELREGLTQEHLEEALLGPWRSDAPLPSMSWDSTMSRQYALRATDPSGEKRGSVAGANWLAVIGLVFFPVQVQRGALVTTGVRGTWNDGALAWPVWSEPCTCDEVACLLRGNARKLTLGQRQALGIWQVYEAKINRFGQGYGSFSPAAVVNPHKPVQPVR